MWTDTAVEVFSEQEAAEAPTAVEPPLFDEDSVITTPTAQTLLAEAPTTIFDRPKRPRGSARIAKLQPRANDWELEESYEAAMRQFL